MLEVITEAVLRPHQHACQIWYWQD